jgi:hypothetical protein
MRRHVPVLIALRLVLLLVFILPPPLLLARVSLR